jgi:hypothetical protein
MRSETMVAPKTPEPGKAVEKPGIDEAIDGLSEMLDKAIARRPFDKIADNADQREDDDDD